MKRNMNLKAGVGFLLFFVMAQNVQAQRTSSKRRGNNPTNNNTTQQADTTGQPNTTNNITSRPVYDPNSTIPYIIDSSGLSDTVVKKSLRVDNAFDKSSLTKRIPL